MVLSTVMMSLSDQRMTMFSKVMGVMIIWMVVKEMIRCMVVKDLTHSRVVKEMILYLAEPETIKLKGAQEMTG